MKNGHVGITKSFNAILFFYCFYTWVIALFNEDPGKSNPSYWDKIGEWSPVFELGLAILCWLILIFWGSWVLKEFWNRLLVDLFSVRDIIFDEALAGILIIGILIL